MERKGVCMKIGIYGGTFNPPHLGHLEAARTAVKVLELDKLILIPAAVPPHKALPEGTPEGAHRLAMTERMADALSMPKVAEVSRMELDREGKSYTADTLRAIRAQYPNAQLWLLMGTDMFLTLHLWHDPEVITSWRGSAPLAEQSRTERSCSPPRGSSSPRSIRPRSSPSPCRDWWMCPLPGCGSCWPGGRDRSICSPRCTAIS